MPGAALDIDPEKVYFDDVEVGSTRTRSLHVRNRSETPVNVLAVSIVPGASPFAIVYDSCSGAALGQHDRCKIKVSFTATHAGFDDATLTVSTNASQQNVPLRGEGEGWHRHEKHGGR